MSRRKKMAKAVPFNAADLANIAKSSPYIQRLVEDAQLRENVQKAIESGRSAFDRITNGKAPAKALINDKKLQADVRTAVEAVRDATTALTESPSKRAARKGFGFGRKLLLVGTVGGLALVGNEKLRSKVLDTLFGAEEEFQYTPPAGTPATPPAAPVSAA
jgi:hypothetical protein